MVPNIDLIIITEFIAHLVHNKSAFLKLYEAPIFIWYRKMPQTLKDQIFKQDNELLPEEIEEVEA